MRLLYRDQPVFIHTFAHQLGSERHDLRELKAAGLLAGSVETLAATGYRYCFGLAERETLLTLALQPLGATLRRAPEPRALVFQHCHAESAVLPYEPGDTVGASRNNYFPAAAMKALEIDHLPYLCSFASGCAGFISLLIMAAGVVSGADERSIVCVMADSRPPGIPFDLLRERILGSDHSSAFLMDRKQQGYQLLGVSYYSTARKLVPLVEIVKRTVEMIERLATDLELTLMEADVALHYPNTFPDTWKMVTRYLRLAMAEHIMDEMAERAHCGASDSVITLSRHQSGRKGRLHVVVNYGVGLHLGVCILKEWKREQSPL